MRVVLLVNNWVGWKVTEWLSGRVEVGGLVLHPEKRRTYGDEIARSAAVPAEGIFSAEHLHEPETLARIADVKADMAVSILFDYILKPSFLDLFPQGVINLHPSLLPYNRGQYPNVWSIVDGTPSGVTIHRVDAGIDTGDIIVQREVPVAPNDTGETLYRRLEQASIDLFSSAWPDIAAGKLSGRRQPAGGTCHRTRDVEAIDEIDLDGEYTGRRLLDVLRARTFPPYRGAYFCEGGKRIYLRLQLIPEDELEGSL